MKTELYQVPKITDLFIDNLNDAFKNEQLNLLLNQEPRLEWIKTHPFIKGYKYLPIDKIEFLLKKIFKRYAIEIRNQGTAFNGVWVTVRVHYWNPAMNDMAWHDGIGACQLQTSKGTSPADLANINQGALSMAFPIAKTIAIKDACDHFGKIFGADLNRKDTIPFEFSSSLQPTPIEELRELFEMKKEKLTEQEISDAIRIMDGNEINSFKKLQTLLKTK